MRRDKRSRRVVVARNGPRKERVKWNGVGLEVVCSTVLLSLLAAGGVLFLQTWS